LLHANGLLFAGPGLESEENEAGKNGNLSRSLGHLHGRLSGLKPCAARACPTAGPNQRSCGGGLGLPMERHAQVAPIRASSPSWGPLCVQCVCGYPSLLNAIWMHATKPSWINSNFFCFLVGFMAGHVCMSRGRAAVLWTRLCGRRWRAWSSLCCNLKHYCALYNNNEITLLLRTAA
jgi:hypothetical protein